MQSAGSLSCLCLSCQLREVLPVPLQLTEAMMLGTSIHCCRLFDYSLTSPSNPSLNWILGKQTSLPRMQPKQRRKNPICFSMPVSDSGDGTVYSPIPLRSFSFPSHNKTYYSPRVECVAELSRIHLRTLIGKSEGYKFCQTMYFSSDLFLLLDCLDTL